MARWLAPQLPRVQHWVLHDVDATLLGHAAASVPAELTADARSTLSIRHQDVTRIAAAELTDAALVTTSALLDLLTAEEVTRIATACAGSGTPALLTLSVTGRVVLTPPNALDATITAAFNAHQRRAVDGRRLLGPDAPGHAAAVFTRLGADVVVADSPWRLGADDAGLLVEWLTGWVGAACEQHPELVGPARGYLRQRLGDAAAGRLEVTVGHADLLAMPAVTPAEP
jgi:hypothetical protein